ncbi:MAG TPA: nucleoside deaminase [Bacteroidetes bacterium]|nr:nucleoside deaminase [Bacteroidota bacterium]HEX04410.1 nucleoside deaminase [Bacteroidota bacterium]
MEMALRLAEEAGRNDEVPIGAVVVKDGKVIGKGRNRTLALNDPTAHAEMDAITAAANTIGSRYLNGATMYVTLEPCPMCAGALWLARIDRLVYAAHDPKAGAIESLYRMHDDPRLNHRYPVTAGVLEDQAADLLRDFFQKKRGKRRAADC